MSGSTQALAPYTQTIFGRSFLNTYLIDFFNRKGKNEIETRRVTGKDTVPQSAQLSELRASLEGYLHGNGGVLTDIVGATAQLMSLGEKFSFRSVSTDTPMEVCLSPIDDNGIKLVIKNTFTSIMIMPMMLSRQSDEFNYIPSDIEINGQTRFMIDALYTNFSPETAPLFNLKLEYHYVAHDSFRAQDDCYELRRRVFSAVLDENIDNIQLFSAVALQNKISTLSNNINDVFFELLQSSKYLKTPQEEFSQEQPGMPGRFIFEATSIEVAPDFAYRASIVERQSLASIKNELFFVNFLINLLENKASYDFWDNHKNIQGLCITLLNYCNNFSGKNIIANGFMEAIKQVQNDTAMFFEIDFTDLLTSIKNNLELQLEERKQFSQSLINHARETLWESVKTLLRNDRIDLSLLLHCYVENKPKLIPIAMRLAEVFQPNSSVSELLNLLGLNEDGRLMPTHDLIEYAEQDAKRINSQQIATENMTAAMNTAGSSYDHDSLEKHFFTYLASMLIFSDSYWRYFTLSDDAEETMSLEQIEYEVLYMLNELYRVVYTIESNYLTSLEFPDSNLLGLNLKRKYDYFYRLVTPPVYKPLQKSRWRELGAPRFLLDSPANREDREVEDRLHQAHRHTIGKQLIRDVLESIAKAELPKNSPNMVENLEKFYSTMFKLYQDASVCLSDTKEKPAYYLGCLKDMFNLLENSISNHQISSDVNTAMCQVLILHFYYISQLDLTPQNILLPFEVFRLGLNMDASDIDEISGLILEGYKNKNNWDANLHTINQTIDSFSNNIDPQVKPLFKSCVLMVLLIHAENLSDKQMITLCQEISQALTDVNVALPQCVINEFMFKKINSIQQENSEVETGLTASSALYANHSNIGTSRDLNAGIYDKANSVSAQAAL